MVTAMVGMIKSKKYICCYETIFFSPEIWNSKKNGFQFLLLLLNSCMHVSTALLLTCIVISWTNKYEILTFFLKPLTSRWMTSLASMGTPEFYWAHGDIICVLLEDNRKIIHLLSFYSWLSAFDCFCCHTNRSRGVSKFCDLKFSYPL